VIGPVLEALFIFRRLRASARAICSCGFALALVVACPGGAEEVPRSRAQITLSFAPVVRAAAPAVVNIYAGKQQRRAYADPFSSDPLFRFFYPDFGGGPLPNHAPENSLGSGVIVDARLRLRRGDLIRTIGEEPVDDVAQLKTILRERPLPWRLEVERAGRELAVVIGG
jgi:S1-C subfamily serine protease